jgi:hypothetical protein
MPMQRELSIRAAAARTFMAEVVWWRSSSAVTSPEFIALLAFGAIGFLAMINAILYFPSFGEAMQLLENCP